MKCVRPEHINSGMHVGEFDLIVHDPLELANHGPHLPRPFPARAHFIASAIADLFLPRF